MRNQARSQTKFSGEANQILGGALYYKKTILISIFNIFRGDNDWV